MKCVLDDLRFTFCSFHSIQPILILNCFHCFILKVNGIVLYGRSHLNASAIIKSLACATYRIIVLRRDGALDEMAVKPLTQFPIHLEDFLEEKYCKFKGVRTISVRKVFLS